MELTELNADEIVLGQPLLVDCYDSHGHLLLRRGLIVSNQKQLDFLLEHGLYARPEERARAKSAQSAAPIAAAVVAKPLSPFGALERLGLRLQPLFFGACAGKLPPLVDLGAECLGAADQIIKLGEGDADALFGAVHLDTSLPYCIRHCVHRAIVCDRIGEHMAIAPEHRRYLVAAALSCDLSIYNIHDQLYGQKDALLPVQRDAIDAHPVATAQILSSAGVTNTRWLTAVMQHHELPNGKGYPRGLVRDSLSEWGLMIKLADMYTAMISPRRYRSASSSKSALRTILLERGTTIDADLAVHFIKTLGVFPPGVWVKLQNGETAIVTHRGLNPKAPRVMSVVGPRGAPFEHPFERRTDSRHHEIVDVVERDELVEIDLPRLWGYNP